MFNRNRMSSVDTAWLRMDSPHNLMMITGVMMFDRKMNFSRLKRTIERRFLKFERFRQCPKQDVTAAYWEADADFNIDRHVCRVKLPAKAGKAELQALASALAAKPLDPDHPLCEFQLVENFAKASALIVRIHHCYADGIALIAVMQSLTTTAGDEDTETKAPVEPSGRKRSGVSGSVIVPAAHRLSGHQGERRRAGDWRSMLGKPGKAAELAAGGYELVKEAAALATCPTILKHASRHTGRSQGRRLGRAHFTRRSQSGRARLGLFGE
jgi:hypothetical protein